MKKIKIKIFKLTLLFLTQNSIASNLNLSDEPLFLSQSVPPALAITFDDSGSMAWSFMPDSRQFKPNKKSFASNDYNLIYYNPSINYLPPLDADGNEMPQGQFDNADREGYYTAITGNEFISRRNLNNDYKPYYWYRPRYDQTSGSYSAYPTGASYSISYAKSGRGNGGHRAFYYTWNGVSTASLDTRLNSGTYTRHNINAALEKQNFANWYTYYNTRAKLAKAAVSRAFSNFGPDFKIDWQQINREKFSDKPTNMDVFTGGHREDFYDWLYLIKSTGGTPLRSATEDTGEMFSESGSTSPYYDSDLGTELTCQQNFHIAISDGSWNGAEGVSGNKDSGSGITTIMPYNISAYPEKMYSDTNYSTMADNSFYYWARDLRTDLDDNVPRFIDDYTDHQGDVVTIATGDDWWDNDELFWNPKNDPANWQHVVMYNVGLGIEGGFDRETDLPGLRNGDLVWPDTAADSCFKRNPANQEIPVTCQLHQCFDSFNIPLDCNLLTQAQGGPIALCQNLDTGNPINCNNRIVRIVSRSEGRVDDVWHSSINSRGDYFGAQDPQELADALQGVVSNIIKRKGRASAGSVSSNIISSNSLTYKTGYDTADWSGFVIAQEINQDGTNGSVLWDAGCKLTGGMCASTNQIVAAPLSSSQRSLVTVNENGSPIEFQFGNLNTLDKTNILNSAYADELILNGASFNTLANQIVDYVRGDRTLEISGSLGEFRNRRSLLGDVIHSPAIIVRGPSASYVDNFWTDGTPEHTAAANGNGYDQFRNANRNRTSVILVGANDGFLHAFDAGLTTNASLGGTEYWGYMPSVALDGLSDFANPNYTHKTFVDSAPFVKDAFISGQWRTMALGGLRHGGKMFYALDLGSDLTTLPTVKWEFSDSDDVDMGYTYSGGIITRIQIPDSSTSVESGWVAILPNGYNSVSDTSVMYAVSLETGALLHKWVTNIGNSSNPNGMGPPVAADYVVYNKDDTNVKYFGSDQGTDFVYAGDLAGNIYKFDMKDIDFSSPGGSSTVTPFYDGSFDTPITTAPRLLASDDGSETIVIVVGTGKYIENSDKVVLAGSPSQYLIGIKDKIDFAGTYVFNDLVAQTFTEQNGGTERLVSSQYVNSLQGWQLELPTLGERVVNSLGRSNRSKTITAISIIPSGSDPCFSGGSSWLMILNAFTGGLPGNDSPFGDSTPVIGHLINDIILGISQLTTIGGNETIINIDTTGNDDGNSQPEQLNAKTSQWRRRSWHRILFD